MPQHLNDFLAPKVILKGDAFHVFQTFEEGGHIDILLHDITDLRPDLVVSNRAINNVIVMDVVCFLVLAVGKDERGPISEIAVETQKP